MIRTAPEETQALAAISTVRYIAGGLTGTFLGFGLGHKLQGRWHDSGGAFTLSEILVGLGMLGVMQECRSFDDAEFQSRCWERYLPYSATFLSLRIAEAVSVWKPPNLDPDRSSWEKQVIPAEKYLDRRFSR